MKIWKRNAKRMSPAFLMMLTLPASSSCRDTVSPVCAVSSDLEVLTPDTVLCSVISKTLS